MSSPSLSAVRIREICDADIGDIVELLRREFPSRTREYWLEVLNRLAKHCTAPDMPKYGYLIESMGAPVGVILLISTMVQDRDTVTIRCDLSSWCVEPRFRVFAALLSSRAIKKKDVT
jgi:hypothetical protein